MAMAAAGAAGLPRRVRRAGPWTAAPSLRRLLFLLLAVASLLVKAADGDTGGRGSNCPRFWLLGAMKCGTSTLNRHLIRHLGGPNGLGQLRKEYHTFTRPRPNLNTYKRLPAGKGPNSTVAIARALQRVDFTLDASPRHLHVPAVPKRVAAICSYRPQEPPRFIVSLCDPGRRAWSHYRHSIGFGHTRKPKQGLAVGFDRLVARKLPVLKRCLASRRGTAGSSSCAVRGSWNNELGWSLFDEELQRWYKAFPRELFLLVERDNWTANVREMVTAAARHFGLEAARLDRVEAGMQLDHKSIGKGARPSDATWAALEEVFRLEEHWRSELTLFGQPRQRAGQRS